MVPYDNQGRLPCLRSVLFFVEMTDTFSGEANYSWVTRFKIQAISPRGVVKILSQKTGLNWRQVWNSGDDLIRYDSLSGLTCVFVDFWEQDRHGHYDVKVIQ